MTPAAPLDAAPLVIAVPTFAFAAFVTWKVTVPAFTVELPTGVADTVAFNVTLTAESEYVLEALAATVVVARGLTVSVFVLSLLPKKFDEGLYVATIV